ISVSGVRRSAGPGGTRDVIYHMDWERTPSASQSVRPSTLPLEQLQAAATTLAHGLSEMGVTAGKTFSVDSLRIVAPMRPVFERLMASLATRGLFKKVAAGYRPAPAFAAAADSAQEALRA